MPYTIQAEITQLRSGAKTLEAQADIIKARIQDIDNEIAPLRASFIGTRAQGFFTKYESDKADMDQWDDLVRSFSQLLAQIATDLQNADQAS